MYIIYTTDNNKWISRTTGKPLSLTPEQETDWDANGPSNPDAIANPNYGATTETQIDE